MVRDEELDEFMEDEWKKQITQEDKIDESVDDYLGEMGWLWNAVRNKLENDKICFVCKNVVDFNKEKPPHILQATKVEPGIVAFVSVCHNCYTKKQEEAEEQKTENINEENKNE